jgi:solute carrier family 30 (zinc transporter), member 9
LLSVPPTLATVVATVPEGVEEKFIEIIRQNPCVWNVHDVKTRQITPELYSMKAELTIDHDFIAEKLGPFLPTQVSAIPLDRERILRELGRRAVQVLSEEIHAIERAVRAAIPEARYIDLEIDQNPSGASNAAPSLSAATD